MKIYDETGEFLGEFFEDTKDKVEDAFDCSWVWGIIFLLVIAPGWTLLGLTLFGIFKLLFTIVKLVFLIIWWIVRLPFCLIFYQEIPEFEW